MQDCRPVHWRCGLANPPLLYSQYLTNLKPLFLATPPCCLTSSLWSSLPFSFLISVAEMVSGNKQSYCRNSRGRFYNEEKNAPPTAPTKRVRFRSKEEPPLSPRSCLTTVKSANGLQLLSSESSNGRQMVISSRP
jgi:hypothetical protein